MKKLNKNSIHGESYRTVVSIITLTVSVVSPLFGLLGPATALAATDPGLGAAASFSVLAQTAITGTPTSISGHVGMNNASSNITGLTGAVVAGTIYATDAVPVAPGEAVIDPAVQANASTAYTSNIPSQSSDGSIGPALDALVVTPGVYDIGAGRLNGGVLTLNGAGVYIFRASSDFISSGSVVLTNGARACDVFWRVETLATINGSSFVGTILSGTGVHFGANVALNGRALAIGGDVTLNTGGTISGPTCAAAPTPTPVASGPRTGTINVVKLVINNNGGTSTFLDFPLFINDMSVISGVTNTFSAPGPVFTVTETGSPNYARSFSGDCDSNGGVNLNPGENKFCIVTNDDIGAAVVVAAVPPLIDVVKVPNPLALPGGSGPVTYTYTLRNIGTVPVTDITMVGDTCSPIVRVSGDTNGDLRMDVNETWVHTCTTTLTETHTNTVVATGWANGISAVDIASWTVIVRLPIVPPLIHLVKMPSVFTRSSSGPVTYTFTVTNPRTVALSNVSVYDNKCSPASAHSGDANNNNMLDTWETWTYSCQTNLASNTVNTATATGMANGLTATDVSVATVLVTPPGFPSTGIAPDHKNISWNIITLAGIFVASICYYFVRRKQTI